MEAIEREILTLVEVYKTRVCYKGRMDFLDIGSLPAEASGDVAKRLDRMKIEVPLIPENVWFQVSRLDDGALLPSGGIELGLPPTPFKTQETPARKLGCVDISNLPLIKHNPASLFFCIANFNLEEPSADSKGLAPLSFGLILRGSPHLAERTLDLESDILHSNPSTATHSLMTGQLTKSL